MGVYDPGPPAILRLVARAAAAIRTRQRASWPPAVNAVLAQKTDCDSEVGKREWELPLRGGVVRRNQRAADPGMISDLAHSAISEEPITCSRIQIHMT